MATQFIILSSAYVGPDIVAEFGRLPPAFLPVGTRRLVERQLQLARRFDAEVVLSLPEGFVPLPSDQRVLDENRVTLVKVPATATLREAALAALAHIPVDTRTIILFGDTLVQPGIMQPDSFSVGHTSHFAVWGGFDTTSGTTSFCEQLTLDRDKEVVAGFFDLSDGRQFHNCLELEPTFFSALSRYSSERNLMPVLAERWMDFGHLHTFYQSRQHELSVRQFNEITCDGYSIVKTGSPSRKIFCEAKWFIDLPIEIKPFVPEFMGLNTDTNLSYQIEYLHLPILSEIFVFGALPTSMWSAVFQSCSDLLGLLQNKCPQEYEMPFDFPARFFDDMVIGKTRDRVSEFLTENAIDPDKEWLLNGSNTPSINKTLDSIISLIEPTQIKHMAIWHGDFHLANMFFDFRSRRIKVIDPRGMISSGHFSMFGDARYDIAKLTHSVVGCYDYILANRFSLNFNGNNIDFCLDVPEDYNDICSEFKRMNMGAIAVDRAENYALTAALFFSMIPLHGEDKLRQRAFLANAFRVAKMAGAF